MQCYVANALQACSLSLSFTNRTCKLQLNVQFKFLSSANSSAEGARTVMGKKEGAHIVQG